MQWASDEGVEDVASGDQVVDRRGDAAAFLRQAVDIAPSVKRFAQQIQSGHYPGDRSTIASAASGITHVINTCLSHGIDAGMLTAARSVIDRAVADGHGPEGLARLTTVLHESGRP
ncbi:hypothetical protein ACSHWO_34095 [Streptomyces sp. HUAS TT3]|uniref:imine reductase family protein n=1 Tax=Streptomyces sp. HUAS TT3 TaxID=3447510 RepID=UPI003F654E3B